MHESQAFEPRSTHRAERPGDDDVELRMVGDRLRVLLVASPWGMPRRNRRPPAVLLKPGEWVRWQINYRFAGGCPCGAEWSYRFDTLNLAHGPVRGDTFLGEPHHTVDERGFLR